MLTKQSDVVDPLHDEFVRYSRYLIDHPPPEGMLFVLVEVLRKVAELTVWLEERKKKEWE